MRKYLMVILMLLVAFPAGAAVDIGDPAPALKGVFLDGTGYDLAALKGQVVIVHFWASWCAPCKAEMPALDAFYREHAGQGLAMIALSADRSRDRDEVTQQMQAFHFPAGMLGDVADNGFGRPGVIPVTYLVDRGGIVRARLTPDPEPMSAAELQQAVMPLLKDGK